MRLLALDAATEHCSVGVLVGTRWIERSAEAGKAHSERILHMVAEVLGEAQVALADLDGIAASVGPGAFTGVRITVAVAQGLAFGAGLRVVPVSTLEALALQALTERPSAMATHALAILDARMQEVYWGSFAAHAARGVTVTSAPQVSSPDAVSTFGVRHSGIGRGFAAYPALRQLPDLQVPPGADAATPRAREFAQLGALRLNAGESLDAADLQPLYLRDKVAQTEAERAAGPLVVPSRG